MCLCCLCVYFLFAHRWASDKTISFFVFLPIFIFLFFNICFYNNVFLNCMCFVSWVSVFAFCVCQIRFLFAKKLKNPRNWTRSIDKIVTDYFCSVYCVWLLFHFVWKREKKSHKLTENNKKKFQVYISNKQLSKYWTVKIVISSCISSFSFIFFSQIFTFKKKNLFVRFLSRSRKMLWFVFFFFFFEKRNSTSANDFSHRSFLVLCVLLFVFTVFLCTLMFDFPFVVCV